VEDTADFHVDATNETEFAFLLEHNDQLFDPSLLVPLKRSAVPVITISDVKEIVPDQDGNNLTQVEDRATTDCGCGGAPAAAGRIVGGAEVSPRHSRPYQAYLQSCSTQGCAMCGATLINKRYAITAMHCVEGAVNLVVSLGEHSISSNSETLPAQTIRVERVVRRPDYTEADVNNDIALLRLSSEVVFTSHVVPACLPTDPGRSYAGATAHVSGWGTTQESGDTSSVLKETQQTILANTDPVCVTGAGDSPVPASKLCAYTRGSDSCQGDSGGPLVVREEGRWTLVGVVSYGVGCARPGYAGVYARVSHYLDWIRQNVADGWCGTSAPAQPSLGPSCDLTCSNVGRLTAEASLNGVPCVCTGGHCAAKDGTDVCAMFGHPCGAPPPAPPTTTSPPSYVSPVSCSRPCNLQSALDAVRGQVSATVITVNAGGVPAMCDLVTNYCCPTDWPHSDLCQRLGLQG